MDAHKIEALSKWEIKDLDAKQAIDWLISVNVISGHTALFGLAYFIHCQQQREADLQQRLRELDEKNQTQAIVLAARDKIVERQERMIEKVVDKLARDSCPDDGNCAGFHEKDGCPRCWRRWMEATP